MNSIKKTMVCVAAVGAAMLATATPVVSNVTMTQGSPGRLVTITYSLTEDAVITLDVLTNATPNAETGWASIGGAAICNARGAVWRKVTSADADGQGKYTITWRPDQSWTDESGKGFNIANGCAKAVVTAYALDNTPDYMVVDISAAAQPNTQRYYPAVDFLPGSVLGQMGAITNNVAYKTSMLVMRKIMAKDVMWTMGSTQTESQRPADISEATHQVTLTNNYYIGVFEITQSQWNNTATNSGRRATYYATEASMRPMETVAMDDVRHGYQKANGTKEMDYAFLWPASPNPTSFLGILNSKTGLDFDLPSEAQWEFAARAGHGDGYWGDGSAIENADADAHLAGLGRYNQNGGKDNGSEPATDCGPINGTAIVGSYRPNDWGLYDMSGNVNECCLDWYQQNISTSRDGLGMLYGGRLNIDPMNSTYTLDGHPATESGLNGKAYVPYRGGGHLHAAKYCRPASRMTYLKPADAGKAYGFRVICRAGLR